MDQNTQETHPAGEKRVCVVGAAIVRDGRVLCAQRGPGHDLAGSWEFPGGKIEPGETPRQALVREVEEELLCEVDVLSEVCTTEQRYDFGTVILTTFLCRLRFGEPCLTEHMAMRWELPANMPQLGWAPADREAMRLISRMPV